MTILEMEKFLAEPKNVPPELWGFVWFDLMVPLPNGDEIPLWEVEVCDTPLEEETGPSDAELAKLERGSLVEVMADRYARRLDIFTGEPADRGEDSRVEPMTPQQREDYFFMVDMSPKRVRHTALEREMEFDPQD